MFLEPAQHADVRDAARAAAAKGDADTRPRGRSLGIGGPRTGHGRDEREEDRADDHDYFRNVARDVAPPVPFSTEIISVPSPNS